MIPGAVAPPEEAELVEAVSQVLVILHQPVHRGQEGRIIRDGLVGLTVDIQEDFKVVREGDPAGGIHANHQIIGICAVADRAGDGGKGDRAVIADAANGVSGGDACGPVDQVDAIGRKPGEALCPERYDLKALERRFGSWARIRSRRCINRIRFRRNT